MTYWTALPWIRLLTAGCLGLGTFVTISLAASGNGSVQLSVRSPSGDPVVGAVVLLEPIGSQTHDSPANAAAAAIDADQREPVVIDHTDKTFNPRVSLVPTGGALVFKNSDLFGHHIYSFSPVKRFEIKTPSGATSDPIEFESDGLVSIGCNIHDTMLGFILVSNAPYSGGSNEDGVVALDDVRPGLYTARLWHPDKRGRGFEEMEIEVLKGQVSEVTASLDLKTARRNRTGEAGRSSYR